MLGIYIHVPFCKTRCAYCSFYSTVRHSLVDGYVDALLQEIAQLKAGPASTVYMGGGTPSQLGGERIAAILKSVAQHVGIQTGAEITVEVNPDDVTPALVEQLRMAGVNRVSMGVQSFSDEELCAIHRRHSAEQACQAVMCLHEGGIDNISIDLIYGLPGQTLTSFEHSIDTALSLPVSHISSYALSIEEGTPLYDQLQRGLVHEADEEESVAMYTLLRSRLCCAGFTHYEISNFALPGRESRHNSAYWQGIPYIGLGPGAHGYDGHSTRRQNMPDIGAYIHALTSQPALPAPHTLEQLTPDECYDELVFTRLRTAKGLPLSIVPECRRDYILRMAQKHLDAGLLALHDEVLCLTPKGLFVSDDIFSDLMV